MKQKIITTKWSDYRFDYRSDYRSDYGLTRCKSFSIETLFKRGPENLSFFYSCYSHAGCYKYSKITFFSFFSGLLTKNNAL